MINLQPAKREQVKLRMALIGPSGSGKTRGALDVATAVSTQRIAGLDTEHGRMKLFADRYSFDHSNLKDTTPEGYRDALRVVEMAGTYDVVVFDSLSHEWLAILTEADKFSNWKDLTPRHNDFVAAVVESPLHVIVTMRAKMKYQVSEEERNGRTRQVIERLGVGPIQRENLEYEFDVLGYIDSTHEAQWSNRCDPLVGKVMTPLDAAPVIVDWLAHGDPPEAADPKEVEALRASLVEEGISEATIDEKFSIARGENGGVLHPEYVAKQLAGSKERLAAAERKRKADAAAEQAELAAAQ